MAYFIPAPTPTQFATVPSFQSNPWVSGFELKITGNTTFTINAGCCRALTNNYNIQYPSFSVNAPGVISVDVSTVGAGGCFPNSLASLGLTNDTVFGVYVIANSSGTLAPNSTNATIPTTGQTTAQVVVATGSDFLPSGYDMFRRIALIYVSHSTLFIIPWEQTGHGNERFYMLQNPVAALTSGSATTYTAFDLTTANGAVAPGAQEILLNVTLVSGATASSVQLQPYGASGTSPITIGNPSIGTLAANTIAVTAPNATGNSGMLYLVNAGTTAATIAVAGFVDSLGNTLF